MRIAETAGIGALALSALATAALVTASSRTIDVQRAIVPSPVPPPASTVRSPLVGRCGEPRPHQFAVGSDYRAVLVDARSSLERCMAVDGSYEVQLRFEITEAGRVSKLDVKGPAHGGLAGCLRRASIRLVFPVNEHPVMISTALRHQ